MYTINEERIRKEAKYFYENYSTVREVAKIFNVGKSTVHKDITERLLNIDHALYIKVQKVLQYNKKVRHIRGGEATRRLFLENKKDY